MGWLLGGLYLVIALLVFVMAHAISLSDESLDKYDPFSVSVVLGVFWPLYVVLLFIVKVWEWIGRLVRNGRN